MRVLLACVVLQLSCFNFTRMITHCMCGNGNETDSLPAQFAL